MAELVRRLRPGIDYKVDDDGRNVHLTDTGINVVEKALGGVDLFSAEDTTLLSRVNLALHAHALLHRDVHYVVRDGKVRRSTSRAAVSRSPALARRPAGRGGSQGAPDAR